MPAGKPETCRAPPGIALKPKLTSMGEMPFGTDVRGEHAKTASGPEPSKKPKKSHED